MYFTNTLARYRKTFYNIGHSYDEVKTSPTAQDQHTFQLATR